MVDFARHSAHRCIRQWDRLQTTRQWDRLQINHQQTLPVEEWQLFSIMGGVGHISHTYQSGCPSTGSLGCLDTSRVSSSNHQILAASNKPLLLSKEVNTEIIYFTPCWSLHCRQYCPPVPMIEVNHWDHAVLSSSDYKDSWYRGLSIRNSFFKMATQTVLNSLDVTKPKNCVLKIYKKFCFFLRVSSYKSLLKTQKPEHPAGSRPNLT